MKDLRIDCPVFLENNIPVVNANAFRILEEVGDTYFLDFLYSAPGIPVHVVKRVLVQKNTLETIFARLDLDLVDSKGVN